MIQGDRCLAFDIKVSSVPNLTKGFYTASGDVAPERNFVVSRNDDTWQNTEGVLFTNLRALPDQLSAITAL